MKEYKVYCDKCGKEFTYATEKWASIARLYKLKRFQIMKLYYGNMSGYDYVKEEYELCNDCTKALTDWLRGKE